jgi:hypothetical protein
MITTRQKAEYRGNEWWNWAVWIDGSKAELDAIERVTWQLHPTFPNPDRVVTDRASQFRLESAGWGEFTLRAVVAKKNGEQQELVHDLRLEYPDDADREAPTRGIAQEAPRVLISSSAVDESVARLLRKALVDRGIEIVDPDAAPAALESVELAVFDEIGKADAMVAIMTNTGVRSVLQEIETARKQHTPVIVVEMGKPPVEVSSEIPRFRLEDELHVDGIADSIVSKIQGGYRSKRSR